MDQGIGLQADLCVKIGILCNQDSRLGDEATRRRGNASCEVRKPDSGMLYRNSGLHL
jgi:hypothetical protein